jgi:hypothetical protein
MNLYRPIYLVWSPSNHQADMEEGNNLLLKLELVFRRPTNSLREVRSATCLLLCVTK